MKSRHMSVMHPVIHRRLWRIVPWLCVLLLFAAGAAAFAQETADPPARVGVVTFRQGSVVFAPQGEEEWVELPQNRPITAGDRLWTDSGARAELQMGTASVHVDGQTHLGVSDLDDRVSQFILQQGSVNARVRDLSAGENFEIGTPNLAFRALQPGDYRIDVDTRSGETRVTVQSGLAQLFGEGGTQSVNMGAGQQATFAGRALARVNTEAYALDDFSLWAAERNRVEDQSVSARYVPRGVVGYPQLDAYGQWGQDPNYGAVWYPQVPSAEWAPYRYGHWDWIAPWGWTWIDDAPWGFAPFHYGRWTTIGDRWAWVPGSLAVRPVYAPALVVFMGGLETGFAVDASPSVGWYPLAPGEAWYPVFNASPRYLNFVNFNINLRDHPRHAHNHFWRNHTRGISAMPRDDFRRGRHVGRDWQRLQPRTLGVAQVGVVPPRPERERGRRSEVRQPRFDASQPPRLPNDGQRFDRNDRQGTGRPDAARPFFGNREAAPAVRDQFRAQQEQRQLQRDAERTAREQQRQHPLQPFGRTLPDANRQQQELRVEREQMLREQQERAARIGVERAQREGQQRQHDAAQREAFQRQMQERAQQREAWQHQREQARAARQQAEPQRVPSQPVAPVVTQPRTMPQRVAPQAIPNAPRPQQAAPIGQHPQREGPRGDGGEGRGGGWRGGLHR